MAKSKVGETGQGMTCSVKQQGSGRVDDLGVPLTGPH